MTEAVIKLPRRARYTVDDLFEIPTTAIATRPSSFRRRARSLPLPLEKDGETWRTVEAPTGETHEPPVAVGPDSWITVALDPAELVNL
jgi:hypothetical protein